MDRLPFFHVPTRNARDADHLALMLGIGGVISLVNVGRMIPETQMLWLAFAIAAMVSAPLLWIRVPYAKWGGVVSSLFLGASIIVAARGSSGMGMREYILLGALVVIAIWFVRIDYDHVDGENA